MTWTPASGLGEQAQSRWPQRSLHGCCLGLRYGGPPVVAGEVAKVAKSPGHLWTLKAGAGGPIPSLCCHFSPTYNPA